MSDRPLVVGTAGHIDHGKTRLVQALTGKDTDRLPEEKRRGISIELGYAPLSLPSGRQVSLIDVPGHERFVRNMVAGATGIDMFLLIIDANEGSRPQTHEHLAILRLLDVNRGVVAITKADTADEETIELAVLEAQELVPDAPVVATSAQSGLGLAELLSALGDVAQDVERAPTLGSTRLFVDRSFTLKGIGTIATGTLWSGSIAEGAELLAEPQHLSVRVRTVQVHDRPVATAHAGQRVALGIPGVRPGQLPRGSVLVAPNAYPASYRLDIALEELKPIAQNRRLRVHHGTSEHYGRLVHAHDGRAQLRLATPAVAARGDRVVLRDETTVGGGVVLDPAPPRRLEPERLDLLEAGDPSSIVLAALAGAAQPLTSEDLKARGLLGPDELADGLAAAVEVGGYYMTRERIEELRDQIAEQLAARAVASPLDPGVPIAELLPDRPWTAALLELLSLDRRGAKAYAPGAAAALGDRAEAAARLLDELATAGYSPTKTGDQELARFLESDGSLVRLGDGFSVAAAAYESARELLLTECATSGEITLGRFRDLIGEGRKAAQLLLERFDSDGVTRRVGDKRVLRRHSRSS